jgi:phage terminase large subunit
MAAPQSEQRRALEMQAQAALELRRRRQGRRTVFGLYRPTGVYGGELVEALTQSDDGSWVCTQAEPDVRLPVAVKPLLTHPKRFKVLVGGRSSAKSVSIGAILSARAKDDGLKTMCLREYQNSIEDSVHAQLCAQIRAHGWLDFELLDRGIRLKGEDVFKFRGLARNPEGVKSAFGFGCSWVEEAQSISQRSLRDLTPSIREAGSELWFSLNPGSSADPMSARFLQPWYAKLRRDRVYEDDLHLVIWMDYTDNPWHRELEAERLYDYQSLAPAEYRHKWHGDYNDTVDRALIPAEHFDAAVDAHIKLGIKPSGAVTAGFDPADGGGDDKGLVIRHGIVVTKAAAMSDGDTNEGCDWAIAAAIAEGVTRFVWDADGLGNALTRQIGQELQPRGVPFAAFHGGESPEDADHPAEDAKAAGANGKQRTNRDAYYNRRAQCYDRLRRAFDATYRAVVKGEYTDPETLISISSDCGELDQLRAEVCRLPRKHNTTGKLQLVSKPDMAKDPYRLPSPNLADSLMMTYTNAGAAQSAPVTINFQGWRRR